MDTSKRITMATVKSFLRKNNGKVLIRVKSRFDGMTDSVEWNRNQGFALAAPAGFPENTLGLSGAWFVGSSRDRLSPLSEPGLVGFHVYNSCGSFDIAVQA